MADFDWFQATVMEPTERFLEWCDATYSDCERAGAKGHNSYLSRADYTREGILQLSVSYGGPNGCPNAKATSGAAPRFAAAAREAFPMQGQLRVTRVDSCQDFEGPGAFDLAHAEMREISQRRKIGSSLAGDWEGLTNGRSYYLGSVTSPFRAVLYEKGIEMRAEIAAAGHPPRPNLCRLEGRLRPQSVDAKIVASTLTPDQVWGCARWAPDVFKAVLSCDVDRIKMSDYRVPDEVLSWRSMGRQYLRTIGHKIAEADHDEATLGKFLMELFDSIQRENSK